MKKNIILAAAAALFLTLGMTSCTDEPIIINGEGTGITDVNTPVKTTADLHNTNWTCTVTLADILGSATGYDMSDIDSIEGAAFESYLNFDGTYAHFTFSDNVEIWGLDANDMMQQITGIDYEYSYDGTTHTGALLGEDEDGNPANLTFTYDDATDDITFVIPMAFDGDTTEYAIPMVFHRSI